MKFYQYDVFLSFTGADRELKNQIGEHLRSLGLSYYDSDLYCKGQFRPDFCKALDSSRVYLMILSDNLRNDPTVTKTGTLSEVRRECSLACDLEARNELNIVILCLSEFFRFDRSFHDINDQIGWFFYSMTRGFSQIRGMVDEKGMLIGKTLEEIASQCTSFIEMRKAGTPVISQAPHLEIAEEKLMDRGVFMGREDKIEQTIDAFGNGRRAVILSGMGGIGKTTLAVEIARRCEERHYLHCPQVVHIREMSGTVGDGLRTLVSSVTYTKEVYDGLITLAEQDKYERKLTALESIPETVLLVIDNFNSLTESDVNDLLGKLKCRLLITTRAKFTERIGGAEIIDVDSLDLDDAYEMFNTISGRESDRDTFGQLYHSVGGHTITLCIMAKLMAVHKMPLETLRAEMGELEKFDARVDFRHNEYGDSNTVLGHLETLFGISDFDEGCCRILRSMSILGHGTVPLDDLMEMLSLRNRNEILKLTRSGWLELQTREEEEGTREYLYLHPILSRLMANQLRPTEENVSEMIAYLVRTSRESRDRMTYADASLLEDGLYYACYVLAGGSKRLSRELWTRFVEINYLLGNVDRTAEKTRALAARVSDSGEQALITAYADMILLEQYPTRVEIFDKYLDALEHNARDYKWVMRSLSVTLSHILGVEKFRPFVLRALDKAIDAAIAQEDDFALLDLFVYYMTVTKNVTPLFRRLRSYIRTQKKHGKLTGSLIYLELLVSGSTVLAAKNASDYIAKMTNNFNSLVNGDFSTSYKMMILHPIAFSRFYGWEKRIAKIDRDDPLLRPLNIMSDEVARFTNEGYIDATALIEAAVCMYQTRLEQQTTLTSASNAVQGFLNMISQFPEDVVRREMGELVERVDMNHLSLRSVSNLQVAMLINREFKNREALTQAKQVIEVFRRLYSDGHSNVLAATLSYGDVCAAFGESELALQSYAKVYRHMKKNTPDSKELSALAGKMLRLSETSTLSIDFLLALREDAKEGKEPLTAGHFYVTQAYLNRLLDKAGRGDIGYDDPAFDEVWDELHKIADSQKRINRFAQIAFMRDIVRGTATAFTNRHEFDRALSLRELITPFFKSKWRDVRASAHILYDYIAFYAASHRRDESVYEQGLAILANCTRKKQLQEISSAVAMLLVSQSCFENKLPHERLLTVPASIEYLNGFVRYFADNCVTVNGAEQLTVDSHVKIETATRQVLCNRINHVLDEVYRKNMNIDARSYAKLRSAEAFLETAIRHLLIEVIQRYEEKPITINLDPPPSKRNVLFDRQVILGRRRARWRLPSINFREEFAREWQPDQIGEARLWLLLSVCQSFYKRPLDKETRPEDPTGKLIAGAEQAWQELRNRISEGDSSALPPTLLFHEDGALEQTIETLLPLVSGLNRTAEEIAQFLRTCDGTLPGAAGDGVNPPALDWETLDRLAAEQEYPRELFIYAGYALCMSDRTLREQPMESMAQAYGVMAATLAPYLSRASYSPCEARNPIDRYAAASFFVKASLTPRCVGESDTPSET